MKMKRTIYLLLFLSVLSACSAGSGDNTAAQNRNTAAPANNSAANLQQSKTADKTNRELQKQIEQIAAEARGRVGVKAVVLETGDSVSLNSDGRFPMQSVYKFPIAMAALRLVDEGKIKLD